MITNKPTTLIIKDRATGKTTQLLYTSATTQYPIIVQNHVLIDEGYNLIGEALDVYMGTHVVAVTLTDRVKELADKKVVRM